MNTRMQEIKEKFMQKDIFCGFIDGDDGESYNNYLSEETKEEIWDFFEKEMLYLIPKGYTSKPEKTIKEQVDEMVRKEEWGTTQQEEKQ